MSFYLRQFEDLLVDKKNQSVWISLNRPEARNAYSISMVKGLVEVLKHADEDNEIRAIVITGMGKSFCAGGDIKSMLGKSGMFAGESNELREAYQIGIQQIPLTISRLKTPLVGMINGAAIGAGCDLAAMCDLRIASKEAVFAETFAKVGLVPGDGGAYFLSRVIGYSKAMEMFLTCKNVDADEALRIGLVNDMVPQEKLKESTEELVEKLCSLPPISLQMTKKAVVNGYVNDLEAHLELMAAYQGITQRSSDHFKALESMMNKTRPTFNHT